MIAACPKCHTRYRVQPEQLGPDGARLRCSQCSAVFRVRPPTQATNPDQSARADAALGAPRSPQASEASAQRGAAERSASGPKASEASAQRGAAERSASGPKASEVHEGASASASTGRNDGLEGRRSDAPAFGSASSDADRPTLDLPAPARARLGRELPEPPEPGPRFDRERLVIVAHAEPATCKEVADALEGWGLQTQVAHDGVEAMLAIQRALPRAVVLDAALPKMFGFQVCEIVKRNESLREMRVVLVGAIHKEERYRRAPRHLYGADVYVEPPDLPDALREILAGFGLPIDADATPAPHPARPDYGHVTRGGTPARPIAPDPTPSPLEAPDTDLRAPAHADAAPGVRRSLQASEASAQRGAAERSSSGPQASEVHKGAGAPASTGWNAGLEGRCSDAPAPAPRPVAAPPPEPAPAAADPLAAERAKAERLARIIVSDIVLYNPDKFAEAARAGGDILAAMHDELAEGRALFKGRIGAEVRAERDHVGEELVRAARSRSGQ